MAVAISSMKVRIGGTVAADVTALEVDGVAASIAVDRTWSVEVTVPASPGTSHVAVTAIGPRRRETRLVAVERLAAAPTGAG